MTTLFIASGGGHLAELHALRPRLGAVAEDVVWVTFDTPQSRSLLRGENVVYAGNASPRDVVAIAQNTYTAVSLLRRTPCEFAVSTGASLALSFLPVARIHGASCHFIESATRTAGPSASGRLLSRIPGIDLYTQHPGWAAPPWRYAGSVLDGFRPVDRVGKNAIEQVVVSLGTVGKYGFRRLLERLVEVLPRSASVLWQTGATDVTGLPINARPHVPAEELEQACRDADLVVGHAGAGLSLTAFAAGKCPVLVARRKAFDEHVDDHQEEILRVLSNRGLAIAASVKTLSVGHFESATTRGIIAQDVDDFRLVSGTSLKVGALA